MGPTNARIPFVQVKESRVEKWFADAGKSLEKIQGDIDKDLKPQSFAFPDTIRVDANLDVQRAVKTVHNVAAFVPGESDEYVIIGAHYDHLGLGGQYSLAPSQTGTIHPGADDNASGTAGVMELARVLRQTASPEAWHSVPELRRRRTGTARVGLLCRPPRCCPWTRLSP